MIVVLWKKKLHETQGSQSKFHGIKYINLIFIYLFIYLLLLLLLLLLYSTILDIEHSSYYMALGSTQSDLVTTNTVTIYIYIYIYI